MAYSSIAKPTDHFNTKLYTGNGSTNALTGVGFQPDLVWAKSRSQGNSHVLFDVIRTFAGNKEIQSNNDGAEGASDSAGYGYISAVGADGFTAKAGTSGGDYTNVNSQNYVAWNWKAGGGQGSSNTDGSINTTYTSANTTAGFSISKYTGTGSNATIGHGLGVAPSMVITKQLGESRDWAVYYRAMGAGNYMNLNASGGETSSSTHWNSTDPTTTVFSVGTSNQTNKSSGVYIAYCFAEIKGYSKMGKYVGNGNTNGPFAYTGFKPAWIMWKKHNTANEGWMMWDNKRSVDNPNDKYMTANGTGADSTRDTFDMLSNGFKIRTSNGDSNQSDSKYYYLAFAENPFVANDSGTAVPVTAK